ncbi:MAG: hypothetical protein JSR00_07490 [Bacteroidetes bacterium]|nr:hypothetical protein [Bacteroidota bacterium]
MQEILLYTGIGILVGFLAGYFLQKIVVNKVKRDHKSLSGFLESEKLKKEKLEKEIQSLLSIKAQGENELVNQINQLKNEVKMMDYDIILLQKNNEDTEALLKAGEPVIYDLKLKLIEANNTIARLKGELLKNKS